MGGNFQAGTIEVRSLIMKEKHKELCGLLIILAIIFSFMLILSYFQHERDVDFDNSLKKDDKILFNL